MRIQLIIPFIIFSSMLGCKTERKKSPIGIFKKSQSLEATVNRLAEENVIGDNIGIAGSSYRFELYKDLNRLASTEELFTLTDHQNPSVRYYAFRALASRRDPSVFQLLVKHINDTSRLTCFYGCIGMEETVVHNLIGLVTSKYPDSLGYKLSAEQSKILDSLIKIYPDPIYGSIKKQE